MRCVAVLAARHRLRVIMIPALLVLARRGKAGRCEARHGKARPRKAPHGSARLGVAWQGRLVAARHAKALRVAAWQGPARLGLARQAGNRGWRASAAPFTFGEWHNRFKLSIGRLLSCYPMQQTHAHTRLSKSSRLQTPLKVLVSTCRASWTLAASLLRATGVCLLRSGLA